MILASGYLIPGAAVRHVIAMAIARDHPGWGPDSFICQPNLAKYRVNFVHSLLESEKGEVTLLEEEVLHSIRDHELSHQWERLAEIQEIQLDLLSELGRKR